MDRPGVRQVPEGGGEQGKWRKQVVKSSVVPLEKAGFVESADNLTPSQPHRVVKIES